MNITKDHVDNLAAQAGFNKLFSNLKTFLRLCRGSWTPRINTKFNQDLPLKKIVIKFAYIF